MAPAVQGLNRSRMDVSMAGSTSRLETLGTTSVTTTSHNTGQQAVFKVHTNTKYHHFVSCTTRRLYLTSRGIRILHHCLLLLLLTSTDLGPAHLLGFFFLMIFFLRFTNRFTTMKKILSYEKLFSY